MNDKGFSMSDLVISQNNTNKIDNVTYDRIKADVFERGFLDKNIYVASDGEIISGNHRVRIAREFGVGFEQQLKIHNLGDLDEQERFRLSEMFNTRGSADDELRSIVFYRIYLNKIGKKPENDKHDPEVVDELHHDFLYTPSRIKQFLIIGYNLVEEYPELIGEADGKIVTNLHLWYIFRLNKTRRIYKGELPKENKDKLVKETVKWLKNTYEETGKRVGADTLQAELRNRLVKEFKVKLPELTDVPWASIWYPEKRVESIRHIIEDEGDGWHSTSGRLTQLGTYKRSLLKMSRDTRVSSFHMSIAFNLIRLLSRNYDMDSRDQKFDNFKIVDPCCGRGIRVITGLLTGHDAYGYDISDDTIAKVHESWPEFADKFQVFDTTITIPHDNDSVDLIFASPPYWSIEKYQDKDGQLSSYKTYNEFLSNYEKMIEECIRVSKKWIVFVVANFRMRKKYYNFCYETENIFFGRVKLFDKIILGHDLSKPTGGTISLINNHTRSAHDEMLIFRKE